MKIVPCESAHHQALFAPSLGSLEDFLSHQVEQLHKHQLRCQGHRLQPLQLAKSGSQPSEGRDLL